MRKRGPQALGIYHWFDLPKMQKSKRRQARDDVHYPKRAGAQAQVHVAREMGMVASGHDYTLVSRSDWTLIAGCFACPIALPISIGFLWIIWVSEGNQVGYASRP